VCLAIAIGSFQHTKPARLLTLLSIERGGGGEATGEHTFPTPHDTCHHVTITVGIGYSLFVDNTLCGSREVGPYRVETIFYVSYLVKSNRCASIAFYTTDALALLVVTAKTLRDDFRGYQHTADF
jgi:hypothetical protein